MGCYFLVFSFLFFFVTGKGKLIWFFCFMGTLLTSGWDFLVAVVIFFNVQRNVALPQHLF